MASADDIDVGFQALREWLAETGLAPADAKIRHLVGDVSRRRYLRVQLDDEAKGSMVLAIYPEDMASAYRRFLETSELLTAADIPVPEVLARDELLRFMAIEDVGDRALYNLPVGSLEAEEAYLETVALLPRLRDIPRDTVEQLNPPLDRELLRWEIDQTWKLFFAPALAADDEIRRRLELAHEQTLKRLSARPAIVCHRDLMARNLQLTGRGIVVLDHQDLRLGPLGYDLASLLHDSLRLSPRQRQLVETRGLELIAAGMAGELGDIRDVRDVREGSAATALSTSTEADADASMKLARSAVELARDGYWLCVVQRTSKIIGTFCSFALQGGRRHLPLIPAAIESLCEGLRETGIWPAADEELTPLLLQYWSANLDDFGREPVRP